MTSLIRYARPLSKKSEDWLSTPAEPESDASAPTSASPSTPSAGGRSTSASETSPSPPTKDLVRLVKKLFAVVVVASNYILRKTALWAPRKTLLCYNVTYNQILRQVDLWYGTHWFETYRWYFVVLKTKSKLKKCDERWEHLVNRINEDRKFVEDDDMRVENRKWTYMKLYPMFYS
jgi:hypothetical protein